MPCGLLRGQPTGHAWPSHFPCHSCCLARWEKAAGKEWCVDTSFPPSPGALEAAPSCFPQLFRFHVSGRHYPWKSVSAAEWNLRFTGDLGIDLHTQGLFSFLFFGGLTPHSSPSAWLHFYRRWRFEHWVWKQRRFRGVWAQQQLLGVHGWEMEPTNWGSPVLQKQTLKGLHHSALRWFFQVLRQPLSQLKNGNQRHGLVGSVHSNILHRMPITAHFSSPILPFILLPSFE